MSTTAVNMGALEEYFKRGIDAREFLEEMHDVMTDYMLLIADSDTGIDSERRQHLDFLATLYRTVRQATDF